MQLLLDGTVLANDAGSLHNVWRRFVPSATGGYTAGTWTTTTVLSNNGRQYYGTGLLPDGRLFVGGGEDVWDSNNNPITDRNDPNNVNDPDHSRCEIFDPRANGGTGTWTNVASFPTSNFLGDGMVAPYPDGSGRLLVAPAAGSTLSAVFDSNNLGGPWGNNKNVPARGTFDEGSLTLLQNGNIFYTQDGAAVYDTSASNAGWTDVPKPAGYQNPFNTSSGEGAPALTLYDGTVFISSATGNNALFTPSASNPTTGTLRNIASTLVVGGRMDENDQVVLPNGHVFAAVINSSFSSTYKFYEYEPPPVDRFTEVSTGGPTFTGGNLVATPLPDGRVLVANAGSSDVWLYRPSGAQLTSFGQPTLSELTGPINGVYTLTGTTLNGLTNGANRDDEGQNFTSFPVVALAAGSTKKYAQIFNLSSTSIAPNAFGRVYFTLPSGLPVGALSLTVSASGLQSANAVTLNNDGNSVVAGPPQRMIFLD